MIRELVRAILAWAVTLIALLFATNARAAECFPMADLFGALATQYGEAPKDQGLTSDGNLMQLWAGESGSWTLVIVTPHGTVCCDTQQMISWTRGKGRSRTFSHHSPASCISASRSASPWHRAGLHQQTRCLPRSGARSSVGSISRENLSHTSSRVPSRPMTNGLPHGDPRPM